MKRVLAKDLPFARAGAEVRFVSGIGGEPGHFEVLSDKTDLCNPEWRYIGSAREFDLESKGWIKEVAQMPNIDELWDKYSLVIEKKNAGQLAIDKQNFTKAMAEALSYIADPN